jgi:hypothetical protein
MLFGLMVEDYLGPVWVSDFSKCNFKNCVFKNCVFEIVTF